jgi:ADP-ribose pyrophosphatase
MELYRGTRLSIEKREVTLPGGKVVERVMVHPGDAVAILPVIGDASCYLLRQFRFAVGDYIYEAPAGTLNHGESPLDTARRELIEETGFKADTFIPRGFIFTTPGFTDERIHLFEAHTLTPSCEYEKDEDEVIEVEKVTFTELGAMISDGRINDAKTICLAYRCIGERK